MNANDFFSQLSFGATFRQKSLGRDVLPLSGGKGDDCSSLKTKAIDSALDFFGEKGNKVESKLETTTQKHKEKDDMQVKDVKDVKDVNEGNEGNGQSTLKSVEEAKSFRNLHRIKVYEDDALVPHPIVCIEDLLERKGFRDLKHLSSALSKAEYSELTAIQMQAIPLMMERREMIACAPTGSGKSMAFLLPLLANLKSLRLKDLKKPLPKDSKTRSKKKDIKVGDLDEKVGFRALIITPTKELAMQINREWAKISTGERLKAMVLRKANVDSVKVQQFNHDLLISTPMRLVNALKNGQLSLSSIRWLILDESDKLLDVGFLDQVDEIMESCSHKRLYRALFSATVNSGVETLAKTFMKNPVRLVIGSKHGAADTVDQKLVYAGSEEGKLVAFRQMIVEGFRPPMLIFVQSIERAKELFHELIYDGINVDVIHAERTASQRENIIKNFRLGKIWVLIATDLISRGVDFKGVETVINYDFPQTSASYIHRIGRTGRAGRRGTAITYFTRDDAPHLKLVCNVMKESGCAVPEWMMDLKTLAKKEKTNLKKRPIDRKSISTACSLDKKERAKKRLMITQSKNQISASASSKSSSK